MLESGIEGLIHISEISDEHIAHPKEVLHEGDTVTLRVIKIETDSHRIGLSLRRVESLAFADMDMKVLEKELEGTDIKVVSGDDLPTEETEEQAVEAEESEESETAPDAEAPVDETPEEPSAFQEPEESAQPAEEPEPVMEEEAAGEPPQPESTAAPAEDDDSADTDEQPAQDEETPA